MNRTYHLKPDRHRLIVALVWLLRFAVGGVFIFSGLVKAIDIWGFVFKIEDYLNVWHIVTWRSLTFLGALALAGTEFVCGVMLFIGAFRKSVIWWMLAMMAFFLPLGAYIMMENPVPDCGCFGDALAISNTATFWKNVALVATLVFLARYNRYAKAPVNQYIQWLPLVLSSLYIIIVSLIGYNIQPLIDFRSFPIGSRLLPDESESDSEEGEEISFIYEKNGVRKIFSIDNLPDSTWEFVERIEPEIPASDQRTDFAVIDHGYDIAPEIISGSGEEYILVITEMNRADISYTLAINELQKLTEERGGSFICLVSAGDPDAISDWEDLSMSSYPIYVAEPTLLKELSRGVMSLVKLNDGVISWKRSVGSLSIDEQDDAEPEDLAALLLLHGKHFLLIISIILVGAIAVCAFPSFFIRKRPRRPRILWNKRRKK